MLKKRILLIERCRKSWYDFESVNQFHLSCPWLHLWNVPQTKITRTSNQWLHSCKHLQVNSLKLSGCEWQTCVLMDEVICNQRRVLWDLSAVDYGIKTKWGPCWVVKKLRLTYFLIMFPKVWSSLLTVKMAAFGTFVSNSLIILESWELLNRIMKATNPGCRLNYQLTSSHPHTTRKTQRLVARSFLFGVLNILKT